MTTNLSQRELESYLWGAATLLRGLVDASDYKNYVLTMLFLKYLSDVWQDHYEGYQAKYGNEPALIAAMTSIATSGDSRFSLARRS